LHIDYRADRSAFLAGSLSDFLGKRSSIVASKSARYIHILDLHPAR
jgi:hypothetical protein